MLEQGTDVNSTDENGKTALWWASFKGNSALVTLHLGHNADKTMRDNTRRQTPLEVATEIALRGYREPGEENPHATIVNLLSPGVESRPSASSQSPDQEVNTLANHMSRLGIRGSASSSPNGVAATPPIKPAASQKHEEEHTCTLI